MRSPRRVLVATVAGVVVVAGIGWGVSTRLRSPADEAALRKAPKASLVTAPVERRKLVSNVVVAGTLEYGSPLPVTLAGVVGGAGEAQRVTRAPRVGKVKQGAVLMEVNGRPVFVLKGAIPMHRTIGPGAKGPDVKQLQRGLRTRVTGVFDQATVAAVTRWYAARGYEAQKPSLADRQSLDTLRKAVQTAQETLVTEQKALDAGRDVLPLKVKLSNARKDLKAAEGALEDAESREYTPEDEVKYEAAEAAVRAAEEKLLEAEQALAAARAQPTTSPTATPAPSAQPSADTRLLELRVTNARQELEAARRSFGRIQEEAKIARTALLEQRRKAVRDAQEAVVSAEQALRQARQVSPAKLKVANARKDVAAAQGLLGEFMRTFGTSIPPGELVFLSQLPARVNKVKVKPGETIEAEVATVTSSSFVVVGSVQSTETELLKDGLPATIEDASGKTYPATLTAFGAKARAATGEKADGEQGSEPVIVTPLSMKGLKGLSGAAVTVKVTVGATDDEVLVVPVAAVVTSADGKPRVQVEVSTDRTRDVEVRTGLTADGNVQVTGDLKEGDRVVVSGA
ncbi:peptidoglycan-binding protein [Nonomuraea sp. NPDC050556]|uniref:peptidoglycan-binding protein n=1 Tax=Nonomuraea sp. NPDC050556 TaxID=3364369 RepID=UPI0037A12214